jgi:hypothetical protein
MKTRIIILLLLFPILLWLSCKKKEQPPWMLPPNDFYFQIIYHNEKLPDTVLNQLALFYVDKDGKKVYYNKSTDTVGGIANHIRFCYEFDGGNSTLDAQGVRVGAYVNVFGVGNNNYWYFEFPNGDIDTLYVESKHLSDEDAYKDPCSCNNPFTVVKYNGKDATIHPNLKPQSGKNIYVLEKQ